MGAAQVIQRNIKQTTSSLWNQIPTVPTYKILDFETNTYHKHFINLAVLVGVISLAKITLNFSQSVKNSLQSNKLPSSKSLGQKYGFHSWVLVADCRQNEQYCKFFAKNGFNLILVGSQQDVRIAKDQVQLLNSLIKTELIVVNWKIEESNISFYEGLSKDLQNFDISFLVLPKLSQPKQIVPTHLQEFQPFSHIYLLVRYFGQKLKWRSYKSAIIFPSYPIYEEVTKSNGISKALISGSDAFGRIISYELRDSIQVVVARGRDIENTIKSLGVQIISQ